MTDLNKHELELLRHMNGEETTITHWGSWLAEAAKVLAGHGYCSRLPNAQITEKGREFLRRKGQPHD